MVSVGAHPGLAGHTAGRPVCTNHCATRVREPSLARICCTCVSAVRREMTSASAICRFVRLSAIKEETSCSRAVRGDVSWPGPEDLILEWVFWRACPPFARATDSAAVGKRIVELFVG